MYDVDGYVEDLSSIHDYTTTINFIDKFTGIKALQAFVENGQTDLMEECIKDIDTIYPRATDEAVKGTLEQLKIGLKKSREITIISQ